MHICALLDDAAFRRVRASLLPSVTIQRLGVYELERELKAGYAGALILDPCIVRGDVFTSILSAAVDGGEAVLLYIPAQGAVGIERALEAARRLVVETVTAGIDDEPAVIRSRVSDMMRPSVPALILHGIADLLVDVPPALQRVSVSLFGWSALPASASTLATKVGVPMRTVNRWFEKARLRSGGLLLMGAQLGRAWIPLGNRHYSLTDVARISGLGSVRALTRAFHTVIGMSPRRARRSLNEAMFARPIITAVRR
jgi:AraC-like DNA-binding protein